MIAAPGTLTLPSGVGYSWRSEMAGVIASQPFAVIEAIYDELVELPELPPALLEYRDRDVPILLHSVGLGPCGADHVDMARVSDMAKMALELRSPVVSDHLAFVRGGGIEAGHLIPPPRTSDAVAVTVENLKAIASELPVPFAVENIAPTFGWPEDDMTLSAFVADVIERSGSLLLLDVENLHAAEHNIGLSAQASLRALASLPIAYLHVAGGSLEGGTYHDTHSAPPSAGALALLSLGRDLGLAAPVVIERDVGILTREQLASEVASVAACLG